MIICVGISVSEKNKINFVNGNLLDWMIEGPRREHHMCLITAATDYSIHCKSFNTKNAQLLLTEN